MKYASFGNIYFKLQSYQNHQEDIEYIYSKHETIFAPSSLQFMGTELENLKLSIRFHREFCNPTEEYKKLKDISNKGMAQKLIIATRLIGNFVIKKISSITKQLDIWGKPVIIDCDIEFQQFIEKKLQTRKIKIKYNAPAKKVLNNSKKTKKNN
ncbi:MAG: phage tail protein [Candidatus Dojkabacteria bacterium]|nr:phage tail protein [Candidatus Dojkabacteria bacterium]